MRPRSGTAILRRRGGMQRQILSSAILALPRSTEHASTEGGVARVSVEKQQRGERRLGRRGRAQGRRIPAALTCRRLTNREP
ncbi:hypothetical protein MTO96_011691 [Rhipicephalus appendiculatus]